ncbi:MAG: SPFH domain-containing protein [Bacteroides sp.]|nr:SPFH domain-containing protein [Eubacterium sp.]MCM1419390.1 SPFH domain-containing protein [Roseburia sp.]MCM1463214.1 SPFH domain-containing protein [Bacteroides sp.]
MSEFVIECPHCGKFAQAKTGFFARKKIDCVCGHTINVRTDKLTSRECPHCKNVVAFDQSKGDRAVCPVCHEPVNTYYERSKTAEFSCAQCGVRLIVGKGASAYVCPVCDHENDVAERIKSEEIKRDGLASIIKYEGDRETLVWKHPIEDFNFGSQLIVHESQEAIFFKDGQALDLFGAGRYTLETQQLPMLEKIYPLLTDTEGTFHSEVYFINLSVVMGVKWGTDSKVRMFDPASGLHIEIGASGEFNIRVVHSRKLLLKLIGTTGGLREEDLIGVGNEKTYFRAMIMTQVKAYLAQSIKACGINILEIDEHLMTLSDELKARLNTYLAEYGLEMPEFYVGNILTPDDDPNFKRVKQQYAEQFLLVRQEQIKKSEAEAAAQRKEVEATTAARMKIIGAQGEAEVLKMKAQAEAEAYRMQAEAEAMEMKMKGYTYQQETSRQVGLEAMKNGLGGGANGAGALGDLAGLGIGIGAMSGVIGMTKEAMNPIATEAGQLGQLANQSVTGAWDCTCGQKGVIGNFCNNCGAKRPASTPDTWDCTCGQKGIVGNFCNNCGKKRGE